MPLKNGYKTESLLTILFFEKNLYVRFFNGLYWFNHNLSTTRRTNINFAAGTGKTVAACSGHIDIRKLKPACLA
ncbi:hypothetical protein OU798_10340 [Prolixibacteraceae bacterium Z1-6]|uniref:Uncharacterized protein n=1 Tax=Draconibacterium aestuarii TaxID=2998507 RepID=A0A9X3F531_9BACT|nr:hypothetical protein [Prolixibacteraceae bacterium Z1-6]